MPLLGSNATHFASGLSIYQGDKAAGTKGSGTLPSRGGAQPTVDSRSKWCRITPKQGAEGSLDYDRVAELAMAWQHRVERWIPYLATDNGPPEADIVDPNATYVWKRHRPLDADKWCKGSLSDIFELPTEAHLHGRDQDGNTIHRLEIKIDHAHHFHTNQDHGPLHHIGPNVWPSGLGLKVPVFMFFWRRSFGGDDNWHWLARVPMGGGPTPTPSPTEPSKPTKPTKPTQPTGRKPGGGPPKGGPPGGGPNRPGGATGTPNPHGPGAPGAGPGAGGGSFRNQPVPSVGRGSDFPIPRDPNNPTGGGGGGGGAGFPGPGPPGAPGAKDLPGVGPSGPLPTGPRGLPLTPGGPTPSAGGNRGAGAAGPRPAGGTPDDPEGGSTSSSMQNAQNNYAASSSTHIPNNGAAYLTSRGTLRSRYLLGTPAWENVTHMPARPSVYLLGTVPPSDPWVVPTPVTKTPSNDWTPSGLAPVVQTQSDYDNIPEHSSYMHHTNVVQDNAQISRIAELDQRNRSEHNERKALTVPAFAGSVAATTDFPVADGSLPIVTATRRDGGAVPAGTVTTGSYTVNADGTVSFVVFITPIAAATPVVVGTDISYPIDSKQEVPINPSVC